NTLQDIAILAPLYAATLDRDYFDTNMTQHLATFEEILARYENLIVNDQEKALFEEAKRAYTEYIREAVTIVSATTTEDATALGYQFQPKRMKTVEEF